MRILFCYLVVLTIIGAAAYVGGSVLWYVLANIHPFEDEDEDTQPAEDDGDAWDRGHDEYVDRAVGL